MLVPGYSLIQKNSAFERSVSELLGQQGLSVPRDHLSFEHFLEILDVHPVAFGITTSQVPLVRHLLQCLSASSRPLHSPSPSTSTAVSQGPLLEAAQRLTPPPYPACPVLRNLWYMRVIADLLGVQIKLFTEFNGVLSSRKVGAKSDLRIYVFADSDNQYILLEKRCKKRGQDSPDSSAVSCVASDADQATFSPDSSSSDVPFDSSSSQAPLASAEWFEKTQFSVLTTDSPETSRATLDVKQQKGGRYFPDPAWLHSGFAGLRPFCHRMV